MNKMQKSEKLRFGTAASLDVNRQGTAGARSVSINFIRVGEEQFARLN